MAEAEEAYPDPRLEELIRRSGLVWPQNDEQLDAWLAEQTLDPAEEVWLKGVLQRRLEEARGVGADLGPVPTGDELPQPAKPVVVTAQPRRLTMADLALLNGQLLELVEHGVALPTGLAAYAEDVRGGRLEQVMGTLRVDLESGLELSEAVARQGETFPPLYRSLIAAGEAGGDLRACLALLHEQAEVDAELDQRIREALAYPSLSFLGALLGLFAIAFLVAPYYESMLQWGQVPGLTRAMLGVCGFLRAHVVLSSLGALGLVGLAWRLAPRVVPHAVRFTSGWWTPSRSLGELSRALAGFLQRGLPLPQALRALEGADLHFPTGTVTRVRERIEQGQRLPDALRSEPVFPASYVWIVGAAEQRGDLAETLHSLALRHEREFQRRVRLLEVLVGPVALAFTSLFVACGALVVYLPVFELQKQLQQ